MSRKRKNKQVALLIEGNRGGDYLKIETLGGNLIRLEVGHCCIIVIRHIVPVEFVTAMLFAAVEKNNVEDAMRSAPWPTDFVEKLCSQIRKVV